MLISVIIPMFNAEKTIYKCVNSILSSTFSNIEVIIVDDESRDDSINIVNKINDNRIIIVRQKNAGPSAARNLGLSLAKGEYIMFVDADDYIDKYAIENLSKNIKKDMLIGIKHTDVFKNKIELINYKNEYDKESFINEILNDNLLGVIWGFLFEKIKLNNIHFDDDTFFMEDTIFLFEYITINKINKISFLDKSYGTYFYVQNINSITNRKNNTLEKIKKIMYSLKKIKDVLGNQYDEKIEEKKIKLYEKELRYIKDTKEVNEFFCLLKDEKLYTKNNKNKLFCFLINHKKKYGVICYYRIRWILKKILKIV